MRRFVAALEERGASPWTPFVAAAWVAGLRMLAEYVWIYVPRGLRREGVVWWAHGAAFYLTLILAVAALLRVTTGREPRRVVSVAAAGMVLGVLPPWIDVAVYGPGKFNYDYHLNWLASLSWHLHAPPEVTPIGETLTVWASVVLVGVYARTVGTGWLRTGLAVVGQYGLAVLFVALLPSAAFALASGQTRVSIHEAMMVIWCAVGMAAYVTLRPQLAARLLLRLPQSLLAPNLVILGGALIGVVDAGTVLAAAALFAGAVVFALHNDFYDRREDDAGGRPRVVTADDVVFSSLWLVPLWLVLTAGHFWVTVAAVLFAAVAFAYHADPLRLKCVFPLSYKSEGLLALACLVAGVLSPMRRPISLTLVGEVLLVAGGVSVAALFKDVKDVAADDAAQVRTLYVVLGARGWAEERVHALACALLGVCLLVPPAWLWHLDAPPWVIGGLGVVGAATTAAARSLRPRRRGVAVALVLLNVYLALCSAALLSASG